MNKLHRFSVQLMISDLDAQMHINNAAYERYAQEARYDILKQLGFSYEEIIQQDIHLQPQAATVEFRRQQIAQQELIIDTEWLINSNGEAFWNHNFSNANSKETVATMTYFHRLEKNSSVWTPPGHTELTDKTQRPPMPVIKEFGEACRRSEYRTPVRHIDIDGFKRIPPSIIWRYSEEARWIFIDNTGLSFDKMKEGNTALFWLEGSYRYGRPLRHHDEVIIYTWIEKMQGARIYIRQDGVHGKTGEMVMSVLGEFVTVDIERSKAIRIPEFVLEAFQPFTEITVP